MEPWWKDWSQLADVGVTSLLFWLLFRALRQRRRSYMILAGFAALGLIYVMANAAGFELSSWALLGFMGLCAVVAAVNLQDDLRRSFEALLPGRVRPAPSSGVMDILVRATEHMADRNVGALMVLPGREDVKPQVSGGVHVDANLSEPLLLSLFDPGSPGHDGALIIVGTRVASFAVHLPLSENEAELVGRGTRHASALGISERTDALCIVVSEERGQVSVAKAGALKVVDEAGLREEISRHLRGDPQIQPFNVKALRTYAMELVLAVATAAVLWFAVVPGGVVVSRVLRVPLTLENLPEGYEPDTGKLMVDVTLSGPRRAIYLLTEQQVEVALDAWFVGEGKRVFSVQRADVRAPLGIDVLDVAPRKVELRVRHTGS